VTKVGSKCKYEIRFL